MENSKSNQSGTPIRQPRKGYGQRWPRQYRHRVEGAYSSNPSELLSREPTDGDESKDEGDDNAIELRSVANKVEISTELPDCSLDDIGVSVAGAKIRLWTDPSTEETEEIDRTITLATPIRDGDVAVTYDDPTLTVAVQQPKRR